MRRLAPGSSTCRRWWAQYDRGCMRMLRPLVRLRVGDDGRDTTEGVCGGFAPSGSRSRKSEICLAKGEPIGSPRHRAVRGLYCVKS